jgi:hypothetical protein
MGFIITLLILYVKRILKLFMSILKNIMTKYYYGGLVLLIQPSPFLLTTSANISLLKVERNIRTCFVWVERTKAVRVVQMQGMGH